MAEQDTTEPRAPRRKIVGRDVVRRDPEIRDLKGWRSIAAFLDRSVGWCRVWAGDRHHPMPVYREGDSSMAVAKSAELRDWLKAHHERQRAKAVRLTPGKRP